MATPIHIHPRVEPLSAQELREFFEIGYIIRRGVFSREEIGEITDALGRLYEASKLYNETTLHKGTQIVFDQGRVVRIVWCGAAEPSLLKFGEDPRLTVPASQVLGSQTMDQLICQAHYKMPGDNVDFAWHQDSQNRGYGTSDWTDINGRGSYIQIVTAIDPMTRSNGPLKFIPGSGKEGHLGLDQMRPEEVALRINLNQAIELILDPGDVAMFGPYTVHGSDPNPSNDPRRIFINGYSYPGANRRVYPGTGAGRTIQAPKI